MNASLCINHQAVGGKELRRIINEVNKEPTLQEVILAVARVRKTLAGDVLFILDKDNHDKTATFSEKIRVVLCGDVTINAWVQLITLEITRLDRHERRSPRCGDEGTWRGAQCRPRCSSLRQEDLCRHAEGDPQAANTGSQEAS